MGNLNSPQFNVNGGGIKNLNLKDVQHKIVQFFSSIGIMNKEEKIDKFLNTIVNNTNPAMKEFKSSKNQEAINGFKDFMIHGLGMEFLQKVNDPTIVIKTAFQLLNSINNGMSSDLSKFRANIEANVDTMSNLLNTTESVVSSLKKENKVNDGNNQPQLNKLLNVLEHFVKMAKTQKDFLSILINSPKFKDTEMDIEKLTSKTYNVENMYINDSETSKLLMTLMNDLGQAGSLIYGVKELQKLAKDKNLDIPSKSIEGLVKLSKDYNNHLKDPNIENVAEWVTTLYRIIDSKKREAHSKKEKKGGFEPSLLNKESNVMSELVEEYLGSSENYEGGDPLRKMLKTASATKAMNKSNVFLILAKNFNKELLILGTLLSHLEGYISETNYQLNEDLERYVKRFLIFQTFRTKSLYLALVGYFSDVQSRFLREDFLIKIIKLQILSKEFMNKYSSIKELHEIESQLKVIHTSISDLSSKFKDKFGGDSERYRHIQDMSILEIPDLSDVNNKLIKTVVNTLYHIRLKNMTHYIKKFKLYQSDDYDKLVGKVIGEDLDKVREDYKKIMDALNKFEENINSPDGSEVTYDTPIKLNYAMFIYYLKPTFNNRGEIVARNVTGTNFAEYRGQNVGINNEYKLIKHVFFQLPQALNETQLESEEDANLGVRDHCAWGRKDTEWAVSESEALNQNINGQRLRGNALAQAINNYKEFIKIYYESYINLSYAAQAVDQYLKKFSDKIRVNPELIEKLELLLENTNIGSVLFDKQKLPKLILDILDPNEYHLPEDGLLVNNRPVLSGLANAALVGFPVGAGPANVMTLEQFRRSFVAAEPAALAAGLLPAQLTALRVLVMGNAAITAAALLTALTGNATPPPPVGGAVIGGAAAASLLGNVNVFNLAGGGVLSTQMHIDVFTVFNGINITPLAGGLVFPFAVRYTSDNFSNPDITAPAAADKWRIENSPHYTYSDLNPLIDLLYNRVPDKRTRPTIQNNRTLSYVSSTATSREGYPFMLFRRERRQEPQFNSPINKILNTKEFYKNNTILKNILSIFFNLLKDSVNDNKEQNYMEPKAVLAAITNYLSLGIYKFTYTKPTHGMKHFKDNAINNMNNLSINSLHNNDNLSVFNKDYSAMNLLDTNVRVGLANVNDVDMDNFPEVRETVYGKGHNLLMHMLKAITAKTLTILGLYDIRDYKNNKAYRANLMDPTRMVLGGAPRSHVILEEYSEFYIRIPLVVEFYRMIFYDSMQANTNNVPNRDIGDVITLLPDVSEPFAGIFRHIFLYFHNKSVVDYNEMEMREIVADVNEIIMHFRNKADKDVSFLKFVIYKMIEEVNHKYGVLNRYEYNKYLEKTYEYLNLKHYNVNEMSSFDLVDDDLFDDDGIVNNNIPSDMYSGKPELITKNNMSSQYKQTFNINNDYQVLKSFRKKVFNLLLETAREDNFIQTYNTQSVLFGLDEILAELKLSLHNTKDEKEKFKLIFKLISSTTSFQKIDTMKYVVVHEFITTQLNIVTQILFYLEQLRIRFSNQPTTLNSQHIYSCLESTFNGAHGRFIKDKRHNRMANTMLLDAERTRMMGTLPGFSNLSALGLHLTTTLWPGPGVAVPPQAPNEIFLYATNNGSAANRAAVPLALGVGADIRHRIRTSIDALYGTVPVNLQPSFYYSINCLLRQINMEGPNVPTIGQILTVPGGGAPVARAALRVALVAPGGGALDREDEEVYLSYFVDLMEHDVFKLIRKLLLHPNLCECNFFNNRIKLDISPLEQNLEKQLTNLIQLFNDVKIHINEPELVEDLTLRLSDAFSKYEYLFKSNFSAENVVNNAPQENINNTIQMLERFLNQEVTENEFIPAERNILSFNIPEWQTLYINNINRLSLKFWNSFFISHESHYSVGGGARYKELLNHYKLVNVYGESVQRRQIDSRFPLEVYCEAKGPRARDQTLEVNDLIYAEPHPEAFSTNGLFDFDIISYFNHILSSFLKGCMSEDEARIYKLCPEYMNYTQDTLDNNIDNRYNNIQNITLLTGGLNYADTISNGLNHGGVHNNNILPNILNPYLVSHKNLNEKTINYFNMYDINTIDNAANLYYYNSIVGAQQANIANANARILLDTQVLNYTRMIRRLTVRSNTVRYVDDKFTPLTVIDEPLSRLRKSALLPTIPILNSVSPAGYPAAPAIENPSLFHINSLTIYNDQRQQLPGLPIIISFNNFGGLTLNGTNGEFYRNIDIVSLRQAANARTEPLIAAAPAGPGSEFFPYDLSIINNLLNFTTSGDVTDLVDPNRIIFNKDNFIDNNYLGIELRQFNQNNNDNRVLLRSNATILRNLLTNYNKSPENKLHLYENIAEIPQKTKDAMLGTCHYTKYQINILQKLIQTLNRVRNYSSIQQNNNNNDNVTMRHRLIANNIFNHINALNKQIDIILLELNDEKFNFGETSMDNFDSIKNLTNSDPNISISSCLYSYLTDFKQMPVYNNNDIAVRLAAGDPLIDNALELCPKLFMLGLQGAFYYFNNSFGIIAVAAANINLHRALLAPVAGTMRFGRLHFANSLRPNYTNLQSGLFSVRKLFTANKNKLSINDFSYLKKIITLFNTSVDMKINENVFSNILNNMTDLKFHVDDDPFTLTLAAAYRIDNQCNSWNIDPFAVDRAVNGLPPAGPNLDAVASAMRRINDYFHHDSPLLLSVQNIAAGPLPNPPIVTQNRYIFDNVPFRINSENIKNDEQQYLNQLRRLLERTYVRRTNVNPFNNKDYLIRMNILDLNIMPIDINAMSREIPLAYMFNYASSLDDYIADMTEGSVIDRQILALRDNNSNRQENNTIRNFIDTFFTKYSSAQPEEQLNLNPNISYLFDRNKKLLIRPNMLLNQNFVSAFDTHAFDRNLHYNTLLKTINNMYAAHSTKHIINDFSARLAHDYEHFMENKKYHGNSPDDINAYRLRRIGEAQPAGALNTQFYYQDLFKGIHKAPPTNNNNTRGTYEYTHNTPAVGAIHACFTDTTLALNMEAGGPPFMPRANPAGNQGGYGGTPNNSRRLIPRNNRVYDENLSGRRVLNPFNNLAGLSALTCGPSVQAITVLNNLDMVVFLEDTFNQQFWNVDGSVYRNAASLMATNVVNPLYQHFHYNKDIYAHHDLNTPYLNRCKVNQINLLNTRGGGADNNMLNTLNGGAARGVQSIYECLGRFDIRYIPVDRLQDDRQKRLARFAHVMSRFLYSDNGFSFTFTRQVYFINFAFNLIRHKIKSESLYNTNKVIQGKLYYQDDYDSYDTIMPQQDTLLRQLPRNPLNNGQYQTPPGNFLGNMRF